MSSYAPPVQRLVTELSKLPGIGSRTAQRLAFHILRASAEDAAALAESIREVKEKIGLCEVCFNLTDEPRCRICTDPRRDHGLICVVEEPSDVIPMERTHEYSGVYHVLGGALSPIDGIDPEDLHIAELFARVTLNGEAPVREVILATNPTTTGETTALHIAEELRARGGGTLISRSRAWPAACRWGPTSSTPTRSLWARPSPAGTPCRHLMLFRAVHAPPGGPAHVQARDTPHAAYPSIGACADRARAACGPGLLLGLTRSAGGTERTSARWSSCRR